jgi:hypothetical protein
MREAIRQNPRLTAVSVMPKPNSPSTAAWAKALRFREVPEWPPPKHRFWEDKPRGYVLWPRHRKDLPAAENRTQIAEQVRKCLHSQYWRGNSITFADDVHIEAVLMGLNPELEQLWTAGSEGGAGLWSANQKPSGTLGTGSVSSFSYNAPSHLFLGRDTDERNVKRFGEIGGVDPREVEGIVRGLKLYPINGKSISEQLYIDKRGPYMTIVLPWLRCA